MGACWACQLIIATIASISLSSTSARNYEIVFESVADEIINPEYFGPKSGMTIRRFNKTSASFLYDCLDILKPLPSNTMVEVILYERHDNKYVPSFLQYKNNLCDYVAKEKKPIISDFGHIFGMPPSCPIVGEFRVEHYKPDDRVLPPIIPGPDHWKLLFRLYTPPNENLIQHSIVFLVDRSKAIRGKGTISTPRTLM